MQYSWLQHPFPFFWTQSFIFQLSQWLVWNVLKPIRFDEERNRYVITNFLIMQLLFQLLQSTFLSGALQRKVTVRVTTVKNWVPLISCLWRSTFRMQTRRAIIIVFHCFPPVSDKLRQSLPVIMISLFAAGMYYATRGVQIAFRAQLETKHIIIYKLRDEINYFPERKIMCQDM